MMMGQGQDRRARGADEVLSRSALILSLTKTRIYKIPYTQHDTKT
jgi:hypothetical protein